MNTRGRYDAVLIGCSAGGFHVLQKLVPGLAPALPWPVVICSHVARGRSHLPDLLRDMTTMPTHEAGDKMPLQPGHIYTAVPDYHLLVEPDRTLALSIDAKVCNVRPAVDVLFISAARAFRGRLVGVVLTGANDDGARGLKVIRSMGGLAIVQDPAEADAPEMPRAAIQVAGADHILPAVDIAPLLNRLGGCDRPAQDEPRTGPDH